MCGCQNNNVKFVSGNTEVNNNVYSVPAPKRRLTTACDTFGNCGVVQTDAFTTSCGATLNAERNTTTKTGFPPTGGFTLSVSGYTSPIGLRQFAEELTMLADQLDGQKTTVSLSGNGPIIRKRKANKKSKAKKAKK